MSECLNAIGKGMAELQAENAALRTENERLKRTLKPFADYARWRDANPIPTMPDGIPDTAHLLGVAGEAEIVMAHCRAAAKEIGGTDG